MRKKIASVLLKGSSGKGFGLLSFFFYGVNVSFYLILLERESMKFRKNIALSFNPLAQVRSGP
ncbi:MAG: hypothetical protein E6H06_20380 [Bacteroidetes bacterium]|nr:MAG: hypothetical protein E6H06_20380 [Bacteroidota bacterium]